MRNSRERASTKPSGSAVATASPKPVMNRASEPKRPELSSPVLTISKMRTTVLEKGERTAGLVRLAASCQRAAPAMRLTATVGQRSQRGSERLGSELLLDESAGILPNAPVNEPIVAHRLLARLDAADLPFDRDHLLHVRPGEAIVSSRPEFNPVEFRKGILGKLR